MANKAKKAAAASKTKASKQVVNTQPGIIASIQEVLTKAKQAKKPVTARDILAKLEQKFPDRKPEGMLVTVRAQLSRLPEEKKFAITKKRDGRVTTYIAA